MMLFESISEIGLMIQSYYQGQMSWSMSCKLVQALWQTSVKSATLGFTNSKCWLLGLSLNDVFLIIFLNWIEDPRSSSKFKMMLKVQYTLSRSKDRQESLVATLEKHLKYHNQLFSEETIVECAFNTELALSSNTVVEMLISTFLFGPLIPCHHIHRDTVLTSIHYMQRSLKYIYMFSHMPLYMAELQIK